MLLGFGVVIDLLGLREPLTSWSTDRNGLCAACLEKEINVAKLNPENDTAENTPLPADLVETVEPRE